jgi:hypothetical protein
MRFSTRGFFAKQYPWAACSQAEAVSIIVSYSRIYSITKIDPALCPIARDRHIFKTISAKSKTNWKIFLDDIQ